MLRRLPLCLLFSCFLVNAAPFAVNELARLSPPVVSNDGEWVLYTFNHSEDDSDRKEVRATHLSTGESHSACSSTASCELPVWSPVAGVFSFFKKTEHASELWVHDLGSNRSTRVGKFTTMAPAYVAWSPDACGTAEERPQENVQLSVSNHRKASRPLLS